MASGVEFEEDKINYTHPRPMSGGSSGGASYFGVGGGLNVNRNDPKMVQWLMRRGFAKTPGAAQGILIAVIIINLAITYFIISYIL